MAPTGQTDLSQTAYGKVKECPRNGLRSNAQAFMVRIVYPKNTVKIFLLSKCYRKKMVRVVVDKKIKENTEARKIIQML